ncbi:basic salivary proline-rich protein 2-like isoform X2 [Anolis carolinensis]|uniref:basic salivary proline-rich protein 2-like isoform X2 n=1 Tax=Anolis carolinensis TaxID=28377 RepID=UPI002F2B2A3A
MAGKLVPSECQGAPLGDVERAEEEPAGPAPRTRPQEEPESPSAGLLESTKPASAGLGESEDNGKAPPETPSKTPEAVEGLWPPPGDNTEERLEPRVSEVSLINSFGSEAKRRPSLPAKAPPHPEGPRCESCPSAGFFPCYRTYGEFPRCPPEAPTTRRDAGVQCDGCPEAEKRGPEANNNSKEGKAPSPRTRPHGGARPGSGRPRPQDPAGVKSDGRATPGSSPTRSGVKLGVSSSQRSSPESVLPLPPPPQSRKSLQKTKHRISPTDLNSTELKPLLSNPSPEEKTRPLPAAGAAAGESRQARPAKHHEAVPRPSSSPASSPREPRSTPSRLSLHSLVSWVWRIFRKPGSPQPGPSRQGTPPAATPPRIPLGSRLRLWMARRNVRVRPVP